MVKRHPPESASAPAPEAPAPNLWSEVLAAQRKGKRWQLHAGTPAADSNPPAATPAKNPSIAVNFQMDRLE